MKATDGIRASELILKELEIVQSEIARFDNNSLTVRSWCLATWSGVIAYSVDKDKALIGSAAILTTLSFAFVDLTYRRVQTRFIRRSAQIEELLNSKRLDKYEYSVHRTADGKLEDSSFWVEARIVLKHPYYWSFYVPLIGFAAACAIYVWR